MSISPSLIEPPWQMGPLVQMVKPPFHLRRNSVRACTIFLLLLNNTQKYHSPIDSIGTATRSNITITQGLSPWGSSVELRRKGKAIRKGKFLQPNKYKPIWDHKHCTTAEDPFSKMIYFFPRVSSAGLFEFFILLFSKSTWKKSDTKYWVESSAWVEGGNVTTREAQLFFLIRTTTKYDSGSRITQNRSKLGILGNCSIIGTSRALV